MPPDIEPAPNNQILIAAHNGSLKCISAALCHCQCVDIGTMFQQDVCESTMLVIDCPLEGVPRSSVAGACMLALLRSGVWQYQSFMIYSELYKCSLCQGPGVFIPA